MGRLIRQAGPCTLGTRRQRSHFDALVRAIVYQQLAGKAAAAIHGRSWPCSTGRDSRRRRSWRCRSRRCDRPGCREPRSRRSAISPRSRWTGPCRCGVLAPSDDEIVERLSSVRGIGRWTAEMFLLFQLGRPDVWPVDTVCATATDRQPLAVAPTAKGLMPLGVVYRPYPECRRLVLLACTSLAATCSRPEVERTGVRRRSRAASRSPRRAGHPGRRRRRARPRTPSRPRRCR